MMYMNKFFWYCVRAFSSCGDAIDGVQFTGIPLDRNGRGSGRAQARRRSGYYQ